MISSIEVSTPSKAYPVYLGKHTFSKLNFCINQNKLFKNVFLVIDKNVQILYSKNIISFVKSFPAKVDVFTYHADESHKTIFELKKMFFELLKNNYGRDTLIVSVGGGITGDISGFAAAIFARGIQYVHIPTTLLAMVDSSIGGKTGINFSNTKNIIGSFYQPEFVLIDIDFLSTLPTSELICGIGEILKYGLLIDDDYFQMLKRNINKLFKLDKKFVEEILRVCIKFKASIVEKDEKEESGLRKILNLGHTFAHAIEIEQRHKIKHGQAVVIGLCCALHLSNKLSLLNDKMLAEYLSLFMLLTDKIRIDKCSVDKIYNIMKHDKKNVNERIKFVLLNGAGKILIDLEAEKKDVIYALNNGLQYFIS